MALSLLKRLFSKAAKDARHQRGLDGESAAARYLRRQGLKILLRRYRCRYGEVDLVAREKDVLVFVEVKTRASDEFGEPALAVTQEKQTHMSRIALDYMRRLGHPDIPARFDIVEVIPAGKEWDCRHIRDAFPLSEPYLG